MDKSLRIKDVFIESELKEAYLSYAMSVIVGRALPDVRDGLKPVHRRIIYAMFREGLLSNKKFSKCAGVVGEVLKKFHPHGDISVYDALVRLAQWWNVRYPLIQGHGNFGSIDGDSPAAYRYTEARMSKISEELLRDIDKETINWNANFDDTTKEPEVLSARFPNLLVNGSSGIAVGMATNIPPHNLNEVIKAAIYLINNPNVSVEELVRTNIIQGPDFPIGALILRNNGLMEFYLKGHGSINVKGVTQIEELPNRKSVILIKEIPYQVNKLNLINQIVDSVKSGKIKDIVDIRDESSKKEPVRIYIEVRKDVDPNIILNQLYKFTSLRSTFSAKMLAIVNNVPTVLNLKDYLSNFIAFRKEIVIKRTKFDLKKSEDRLHILEGLKIALDNIDEVIKLIKGSKSGPEAKELLKERFGLTDIQSQAILDMRLQKLTGLEMDKIREEYESLLKYIEELKFILENDDKQYEIIVEELNEIMTKYGDVRRSRLIDDESILSIEDLIQDEDFVILITHNDYIKKVSLDAYRAQKRGGKGVNAHLKDEDTIKNMFIANSKDNVLIFTNDGNINWLKCYDIPTTSVNAKGRPIVNYIDLRGKKITNVINVSDLNVGYLIFLTKKGIIKKTEMKNFAKPRSGGIKAIGLNEGDSVLDVIYTEVGDEDIIIENNKGLAIRFKQSDLSVLGRTAKGVKAMNLRDDEVVVGIELVQSGKTLLTLTQKGYGKRSVLSDYPVIRRGGRGVIDIKTDKRNGNVIRMEAVGSNDEVLIITKKKIIRTPVKDIRIIGRNTKGVKIVNLEDDEVLCVEKIVNDEE